jgi:hypothetical protein
MKQILLGFMLGVVFCLMTGAALFHPSSGIIVRTESREATTVDLKAIMLNQESIYNLIKNTCGDKK